MQFDGRSLVCPLAFVKAKQALVQNNTKVFLLDEEISIYNFCCYLDSQSIPYQTESFATYTQISLSPTN